MSKLRTGEVFWTVSGNTSFHLFSEYGLYIGHMYLTTVHSVAKDDYRVNKDLHVFSVTGYTPKTLTQNLSHFVSAYFKSLRRIMSNWDQIAADIRTLGRLTTSNYLDTAGSIHSAIGDPTKIKDLLTYEPSCKDILKQVMTWASEYTDEYE